MNNSTILISTNSLDLTSHYVYIGFGGAALFGNLVIVLVYTRNFYLMKKSAFVIGLTFGDIVNGLALLVTGVMRIIYAKSGMSNFQVQPLYCLQSLTSLWLLGMQLPSVMMFLIGLERLLAVGRVIWYYKNWSSKYAWCLTVLAYVYCIASVGSEWLLIVYIFNKNTTTSISCTTPFVIGPDYSLYSYGLAIVCGTSSAVTTVVSLIIFLAKKQEFAMSNNSVNMHKHMKKQWQLSTSMACVTVLDFGLVVLPNIFLLMIALSYPFPPIFSTIGFWSAELVCLRSALSFFIYFILNRDFRSLVYKCVGKQHSPTSIFPLHHATDDHNRPMSHFK